MDEYRNWFVLECNDVVDLGSEKLFTSKEEILSKFEDVDWQLN